MFTKPHPTHPDSGALGGALEAVIDIERRFAELTAARARAIDALRVLSIMEAREHGRSMTDVIERGVRLEIAAALGITENSAGRLMVTAESLVHRYPTVLNSLAHAHITPRHADVLIELLDTVEPSLRDTLIDDALSLAETAPVNTLRRTLRRRIDEAQANSLAIRHETALKARRVIVEPGADGMASLIAIMPAVEAHAIFHRLTAMGTRIAKSEDDHRTLDQLRADILGDLLIDGDTATLPATVRGIRASVAITVPALALLNATPAHATAGTSTSASANANANAGSSPGPGVWGIAEAQGIGPLTHEQALQLCGNAEGWTRILTHPETGTPLSIGRRQYRPPASLRRLVRWRAERCMAPGCATPADRCDIDHTTAWEHGGETAADNLAPLCRGHHTVKHHTDWTVTQSAQDGTLRWTSPAGRTYTVTPHRHTPALRPDSHRRARAHTPTPERVPF